MFGNYLSTKEVVSIGMTLFVGLQFVNMVLIALLFKLSRGNGEVKNYFAPSTNKNTAVSGDKNSAS